MGGWLVDGGLLGATALPGDFGEWLLCLLLVAALGALAGAAEIVTRYRDEPFRALTGRYGVAYLCLNMAASLAVFALLASSHDSTFPDLSITWLAILSGLGAMAVLRSKLFTFRTKSGEEVSVGAEAIVKAFLQSADRQIDRQQANARWSETFKYLRDVVTDDQFTRLVSHLRANLNSYQNLDGDAAMFSEAVESIQKSTLNGGHRSIAAGLAFQAICGSDNFRAVASDFRTSESLSPVPSDTGGLKAS